MEVPIAMRNGAGLLSAFIWVMMILFISLLIATITAPDSKTTGDTLVAVVLALLQLIRINGEILEYWVRTRPRNCTIDSTPTPTASNLFADQPRINPLFKE